MNHTQVKKLLINYKTLESFKRFKEYGNQELSMLEDLQNNIVENDSQSPFYGIYFGDNLIARMSLYRVSKKYDAYFEPPQDYWNFGNWKYCQIIKEKVMVRNLSNMPKVISY